MVFAKLWLLGILAAVLVSAATPPSSAPVIVKNEIPNQEQQVIAPTVQPCPDTAVEIAAAESRLGDRIDAARRELQSDVAESATGVAALTERVAQLEKRAEAAEAQVAEQTAEVRRLHGTVSAPVTMTWILTALAGAGVGVGAYFGLRAWRSGHTPRNP
jgi:hypothetical protein